jgi:hypothetical protein
MDPNRTISHFAKLSINALGSNISRPVVDAKNFEIKTHVIQMIQSWCTFYRLTDKDSHAHIINFLEICDTFKINGVSNDAIRLCVFPFSLRDRAKPWLNSLPNSFITTWDDFGQKFVSKYFPPAEEGNITGVIVSNFLRAFEYLQWKIRELFRVKVLYSIIT